MVASLDQASRTWCCYRRMRAADRVLPLVDVSHPEQRSRRLEKVRNSRFRIRQVAVVAETTVGSLEEPGCRSDLGFHLSCLLAALVNLAQKLLEDGLLQAGRLVHGVNLLPDVAHHLFLVLVIDGLELELVKQLLHTSLAILVLAAIVVVEEFALRRGAPCQGLIDQPAALVILDVGANLAQGLGVGKIVEIIVLHLEVLAHGYQNVMRLLEVGFCGQLSVVQGQGDRQIEGVEGGLVVHDEGVLLQAEVVEVDVIFGSGQEIAGLAALGLEGDFVEELDNVDVVWVLAKVFLEDKVDGRFEHERIIDGNHADSIGAVPTRLATSGDGSVHHVVGHKEEGLEELDEPSEGGRLEEVGVGGGQADAGRRLEDGDCVWHRQAAIALASDGVVPQLLVVGRSRDSHTAGSGP
ncbi:hypothetical protein FH972_024410 [Carpinus fangiana]|uniref:Uncharacterized protein n=1 Tax=Carpinus fangiana TaxID=176857 RepID=A0A5N6KYP5_9ROSI|nr:hypothetical protein FH972_024410 [Carpinus fangiana]